MPTRHLLIVLIAVSTWVAGLLIAAEPVILDKPVQINTVKSDKSPLSGRVTSYDDEGFDLVRGKDKSVRVKWSELGPPGVFNVRSAILGPNSTAAHWIDLGRELLALDSGGPLADRAFARALKLDTKLKAEVEAAKKAAAHTTEPAVNDAPTAIDNGSADRPAGATAEGAAGGPRMVGKVQAGAWPILTDQQRAGRVQELKQFAEEAGRKLGKSLVLQETKFFLFYSDLPPQDARNWSGLLDQMYARLAELFAIDREAPPAATGVAATRAAKTAAGRGDFVNIWSGKALVFVFQTADDYLRFEQVVHEIDAAGTAGLCHCFGDGRVHIAFYRQQDPLLFAHVLVHESVHGFIHRFRTPAVVPSWANEGLAEVIAGELVPRNGWARQRELTARRELEGRYDVGGMLEARRIQAWQYPVADTLTAYMIRQNKRNYVDFIMGIKDGLTWEQSLEQRYQAPKDRLVRAYRESLGLKK